MGSEDEQTMEPVASEPRNQRAFITEVGIIVLGVLIALFIGEAATAVRQRVDAQRSMEAIRTDMIDNSAQFEIAVLINPCAARRLDAISEEVARARQTGILRDIGDVGEWGGFTTRTGAWESAVANQNILFMDKKRVGTLTDYHEALKLYKSFQNDAWIGWARLSVLTHAPGRVSDDTIASVSQTIAELRYQTRSTTFIATILLQAHQKLGFPVEYMPVNDKPQTRQEVVSSIASAPNCQSLEVSE